MSELALQQINSKLDVLLKRESLYSREIEGLVSNKYKLEAALNMSELARDRALEENKKLKYAIYRNLDPNTTHFCREVVNEVHAELEPNT